MDLSNEQIDSIRLLQTHGGFKLYLVLLKSEFDKQYKRLRKCSRDKTFDKINGSLDSLEYAMFLVNNIVEESHKPGDGPAQEE